MIYKVSLILGDGDGVARYKFIGVWENLEKAKYDNYDTVKTFISYRIEIIKKRIEKNKLNNESIRNRDKRNLDFYNHLDLVDEADNDYIIVGKEKDYSECGYGKVGGLLIEKIKIN